MNPSGLRESEGGSRTDAYVWEVPGKRMRVEIDFDLMDRLEAEVMRAFGSTPRRGLEVGGILLGSCESGITNHVRIEDYEPILSRHEHGPSYILSGRETDQFAAAVARWGAQDSLRSRAVGFFRSHTREGLGLEQEDLELFSRYFPEETAVSLIIKPYATRPPVAGIFFREEATIRTESSYQEFPFRKCEVGGATRAKQSPPASRNGHLAVSGPFEPPAPEEPSESDKLLFQDSGGETPSPSRTRRSLDYRSGWVWIPLSVIFLLLGMALGFQIALAVRGEIGAGSGQDPYALYLSVTPSAGSIHLSWDRTSPVLSAAKSGRLVISDDGEERTVDLNIVQLRNGSVAYSGASGDLDFRLEVVTTKDVIVAETLEYQVPSAEER